LEGWLWHKQNKAAKKAHYCLDSYPIYTPKTRINSINNTMPIAVSLKKNKSWHKVEHRFHEDMKKMTNRMLPILCYHRRPIWINTPCGLNHAVTVGFCLFSKLTQTSKRNNTKLLQEPQFGCAKMQQSPSILACMLFAPHARLPRGQVLPPPAGGSGKGQYMNPAIVRNKFIIYIY
jgi:hypothetical protein